MNDHSNLLVYCTIIAMKVVKYINLKKYVRAWDNNTTAGADVFIWLYCNRLT